MYSRLDLGVNQLERFVGKQQSISYSGLEMKGVEEESEYSLL